MDQSSRRASHSEYLAVQKFIDRVLHRRSRDSRFGFYALRLELPRRARRDWAFSMAREFAYAPDLSRPESRHGVWLGPHVRDGSPPHFHGIAFSPHTETWFVQRWREVTGASKSAARVREVFGEVVADETWLGDSDTRRVRTLINGTVLKGCHEIPHLNIPLLDRVVVTGRFRRMWLRSFEMWIARFHASPLDGVGLSASKTPPRPHL